MSSLKEALLNAGLSSSKAGRAPKKKRRQVRNDLPDLAEAYRARDLDDKAKAEQTKRAKLAEQQARRALNLEIERLLKDKVLNDPNATLPRYFEWRGRIRRVLCTEQQRESLNVGQLAVVMFRGSARLVGLDVASAVRQIAAEIVPDLGQEPSKVSLGAEDGYPPVPDDLIW